MEKNNRVIETYVGENCNEQQKKKKHNILENRKTKKKGFDETCLLVNHYYYYFKLKAYIYLNLKYIKKVVSQLYI